MSKRIEEPQPPARRDDDLLTAIDLVRQYGITLQRAHSLFDKGVIPTMLSGSGRRVTTRRAFLDRQERPLGIREHDQAEQAAPPAETNEGGDES
ncbi:MAG: hypothetical protein KC442_10835, partial [Thermomicrobiales bacterium]|nr:hypothetical protein [Thermomicrobiales bacterium]